jgi:3-deoxy-7-phosphoheptulonate synthase
LFIYYMKKSPNPPVPAQLGRWKTGARAWAHRTGRNDSPKPWRRGAGRAYTDPMAVDESAELQLLIMMSGEAPDDQVEGVLSRLTETGSYGRVAPGRESIVIGAFGDREMIRSLSLEESPGVEKVLPIRKPYKLVSAEASPEPSVIQVRGRRLGGDHFGLIAGPCTVESREQTLATARAVEAAGATILRGGAFKPRTSPYSFQGLGSEALAILEEAREDTGLPLATEVLDPRQVEEVVRIADVLQIGARNMQNFLLLSEVGRTDKPVLLKRGPSASLEELLMAAEYILKEGNPRVILCERGIKTFERSTRFTLDISAVPVLKEETHLPVIVDPSHAAGRRELVPALARAAVAAGADGIIVEAHPAPEEALCDAPQLIPTAQFAAFADEITRLVGVMGKTVG